MPFDRQIKADDHLPEEQTNINRSFLSLKAPDEIAAMVCSFYLIIYLSCKLTFHNELVVQALIQAGNATTLKLEMHLKFWQIFRNFIILTFLLWIHLLVRGGFWEDTRCNNIPRRSSSSSTNRIVIISTNQYVNTLKKSHCSSNIYGYKCAPHNNSTA